MTTSILWQPWSPPMAADVDIARHAITITALSLLPPRTLKNELFSRWWLSLASASRRNVAITVALPAPCVAHPATLRNIAAAADLANIGAACVLIPPANLLHAKTMRIDDAIAWVGSGNMTAAAHHHNRECWMRTDDKRAVEELAAFQAWCIDAGSPHK